MAALPMFAQVFSTPGVSDARERYGKIPMAFEQHSASSFLARGPGYRVDIRGARASILASQSATKIELEFVGGKSGSAKLEQPLPGKVNYLHGNDPREWRLGLPTYGRVTYPNLYSGIDIVY